MNSIDIKNNYEILHNIYICLSKKTNQNISIFDYKINFNLDESWNSLLSCIQHDIDNKSLKSIIYYLDNLKLNIYSILNIINNNTKNIEQRELIFNNYIITSIIRKYFSENNFKDVDYILEIINFNSFNNNNIYYYITTLSTCFPARFFLNNYIKFYKNLNLKLKENNINPEEVLFGLGINKND